MRTLQAALILIVGVAVSGACGVPSDDKSDKKKTTHESKKDKTSKAAKAEGKVDADEELKKFQGDWTFVSSEAGGTQLPADSLKELVMTFERDKHTVKMGDKVIQVGTQKIDPSKSPKTIDVTMTEGVSKGQVMLGIYELDGDTLKVCFASTGKPRPTEFKSPTGSETFLNVHKRKK